jgi:hypothetical protein
MESIDKHVFLPASRACGRFLVLSHWPGWGLAVFKLSGHQGTCSRLVSLWGKDNRGPVIGRLGLRQGPQPLARLIVSTWTLFRLCFPFRHHRLRLDTRLCPPSLKNTGKKRRQKSTNGRCHGNFWYPRSNAQLATLSPSSRPALLLGTETGGRLHLSGWTRSHRLQASGRCSKSPSSRPS